MTDRPDNPAPPAAVDYQPPPRYDGDALDDAEPLPQSVSPPVLFAAGLAMGVLTTVVVLRVAAPRLPLVSLLGLELVYWAYLALLFAKPAGGGTMAGLRGLKGLGEGFAWSLALDPVCCAASAWLWPG